MSILVGMLGAMAALCAAEERYFAPWAMQRLGPHLPAATSVSLPPAYAAVLMVNLVGATMALIALGTRVGKARKQYKVEVRPRVAGGGWVHCTSCARCAAHAPPAQREGTTRTTLSDATRAPMAAWRRAARQHCRTCCKPTTVTSAAGLTRTAPHRRRTAPRPRPPPGRMQYPTMYAAGVSKDAVKFNCVQRGHQQALETFGAYVTLSLVGGLRHPFAVSIMGVFWIIGRLRWATCYAQGGPEARYGSLFSIFIWLSLFGSLAATMSFAGGLAGVV
jgi:glutathione S-transferase